MRRKWAGSSAPRRGGLRKIGGTPDSVDRRTNNAAGRSSRLAMLRRLRTAIGSGVVGRAEFPSAAMRVRHTSTDRVANADAGSLRAKQYPRPRARVRGYVSRGSMRLRGATVDLALRHDRELLVGRFFLVEVLLQQGGAVAAAELLRPGDQGAIAADLVVLDRLRSRDDRRIEHRLVVDLAGDVFGFLDDAVDGRTIDTLDVLAEDPEHLLEPFHVVLGLAQMALQSLLELRIARLLDHVGQRFHDLVFGVVDVAERVHEQVARRFGVVREQAHGCGSSLLVTRRTAAPPSGRSLAGTLESHVGSALARMSRRAR